MHITVGKTADNNRAQSTGLHGAVDGPRAFLIIPVSKNNPPTALLVRYTRVNMTKLE